MKQYQVEITFVVTEGEMSDVITQEQVQEYVKAALQGEADLPENVVIAVRPL